MIAIFTCLQPLLQIMTFLSFPIRASLLPSRKTRSTPLWEQQWGRVSLSSNLWEVIEGNKPLASASVSAFMLPHSAKWQRCAFHQASQLTVFVAGSVQRGTRASKWERTPTMATPALTRLVGPSCLCLDWWRRITGKTFTSRWAAHYKNGWMNLE